MEAVITDAQRQPNNPVCIYVNRQEIAKDFQLQIATALLTACLGTKNQTPTKNDRQLAEILKTFASSDVKPSAQAMPSASVVTGSLQSLFSWMLQEQYVEAKFIGDCIVAWFGYMSGPVQDDANSRAQRLIRAQNPQELALHAIQHPFAAVPEKQQT